MSKRLVKIAVLVFLGVLLAILPLVACDEEEKITITTEQLTQGITAAIEDVQTYRCYVSDEKEGRFVGDTETNVYTRSTESNRTVDSTNKKMQLIMSKETELPGGNKLEEHEQYIISDIWYGKRVTSYSGELIDIYGEQQIIDGWWKKSNIEFSEEPHELVKYMHLLEISEIEIIGSEKVDGVKCWVVRLLPSLGEFGELMGGIPPEMEELFENVSVKQWFAKDTYYLMKAEVEWTWVVSDSDSMVFSVDVEFSHYNEPVSIELPTEAEEATEVSS